MKCFLKTIPWFLLYSRLCIAFTFTFFVLFPTNYPKYQSLCMFLFYFGFIGDVFDGIIARKLNMDTTMIRRLDSLFDSLFWLAATFLLYKFSTSKDLILYGMGTIIFIILIEYLVCFCRFQKTPSSHNLISKFFGLSLFILYACLFTEIETPTLGIGIIIFGIIAARHFVGLHFKNIPYTKQVDA